MSKTHEIKVTKRELQRKGASRRLRHAGVIPAIVYGGNAEPVAISLDHNATWLAQQNEWFYSSILSLNLDGQITKVLLRDMQRHPHKQLIMHLDFLRVNENEALTANVPLHFINEDTSPAGKASDIVITHELKEVTVSCLPKDLPESIDVDLADLKAGDVVYLSNIKLPKGVEIPALALGKDHDDAIVTAKAGKVDAADEEEAPAAE
jgi:large subunit ribosomal protein L25